jgi:PleD family two-component response regulator
MIAIGCFVVDVNAVRRAELRRRLVSAGVRVVPLRTIEHAIAVMKGITPDALVVDMELPAGHALELARAVRRDATSRHTALVAVVGADDRAQDDGFDVAVARSAAGIGAEVRRVVERGRIRLVRSGGFAPERL